MMQRWLVLVVLMSGTLAWAEITPSGGGSSPADISNTSGWQVIGSSVVLATSTNSVGIGTSSPATLLHLYGGNFTIDNVFTNVDRYINFALGGSTQDFIHYRSYSGGGVNAGIDISGLLKIETFSPQKMGVRTLSPNAQFHVVGSTTIANIFAVGIDTTTNIVSVSTLGVFAVGVTTLVARSGNIGIGTSTPNTKLHMSSGVLTVDGSGAGFSNSGYMVYVASAITIADNGGGTAAAYTLTPIASYNKITCSDANGCDVTMGESGMVDGTVIRVVNVGTNVANFADTSGVSELAGVFAAGQWDSINLMYTTDRWTEVSRSNN